MKIVVSIDGVKAMAVIDGAWTPELVATLLRHCGTEVVRICNAVGGDETPTAEPDVE